MNFNNPRRLLAAAAPKQGLGHVAEDSVFSDAVMASASQSKPKRQTVKAACANCQKRKVKCSGERPMCTLCQTRGQTCTYDAEAGLTRIEALRRRNRDLTDLNADYELILHAFRTGSEEDAMKQLSFFRAASDIESYADQLKQNQIASKRRKSTTHISPTETVSSSNLSQGSPTDYESNMSMSTTTSTHNASRLQSGFKPPMRQTRIAPAQTRAPEESILAQQQAAMAQVYPTASFAERWPFQIPGGSFGDPTTSTNPIHMSHFNPHVPEAPSSERLAQDWHARFDGPRQMIDPILSGGPAAQAFAGPPIQQGEAVVDGEGLQWQQWAYWQQANQGQL